MSKSSQRRNRGHRRRKEFINMAGGKCKQCGYNKSSALTFHHINPSTKCFTLDASECGRRPYEECLEEFNKTELLCLNCHSSEHVSGTLSIFTIRDVVSQIIITLKRYFESRRQLKQAKARLARI